MIAPMIRRGGQIRGLPRRPLPLNGQVRGDYH
jgi:hypothetical protein